MIRRPPRSTLSSSSAASDVYKRQPALKSMQRVYWQVRIWDNKNKVSGWSTPAFWEMGIIEPELWKASWVTLGSEPDVKESKPSQYFRKDFSSEKLSLI